MNRLSVSQQALTKAVAAELKEVKEIQPAAWSSFVKTGLSRQRPPTQEDWWYTRSASIMRKVSMLGPIGTQKLKRKYGGRQNRGYAPAKFQPGSGNITRKILQQLEAAQLIKQVDKEGRKGRVLTPKGHSMLDKAAKKINGTQ